MQRAEDLCRREGVRLTEQRRAVLQALVEAERPCGAYDLIEALDRKGGRRPAPVAIYRALDFLRGLGLVHRLESRNAFVACAHGHGSSDPVVFMICEGCETVAETISPGLQSQLAGIADATGFATRGAVVELTGRCRTCRGRDE